MAILGTVRFIRHILKGAILQRMVIVGSFSPSRGLRYLVRTHRTLNTTSCSHRLAFVLPSGKLLDEKLHLSTAILYGSAAIVC